MEQLVGLILLGLISLISWAIQKSAERREEQKKQRRYDQGEVEQQPEVFNRPSSAPATESEQAMRRLREALGLPDDEEPGQVFQAPYDPEPAPPVIIHRQEPVERPVVFRPTPVIRRSFNPPPLPASERVAVVEEEGPRRKMSLPSRRVTLDEVQVQKSSRVRDLLKAPAGVRDAVILAEILGRPKSFQD